MCTWSQFQCTPPIVLVFFLFALTPPSSPALPMKTSSLNTEMRSEFGSPNSGRIRGPCGGSSGGGGVSGRVREICRFIRGDLRIIRGDFRSFGEISGSFGEFRREFGVGGVRGKFGESSGRIRNSGRVRGEFGESSGRLREELLESSGRFQVEFVRIRGESRENSGRVRGEFGPEWTGNIPRMNRKLVRGPFGSPLAAVSGRNSLDVVSKEKWEKITLQACLWLRIARLTCWKDWIDSV